MRDLSPCCQWWRIASVYLDHGLLSRNAPQTTKFIEIWIEMGIFWFEKKTRSLLLSVLPMAEYIVIIKSPQSGVTLCFQFVSAAASASAAAAMTFASHFKSQGHGCDIDKQKFACLQDKVGTIQPNHYKTGWLYIPPCSCLSPDYILSILSPLIADLSGCGAHPCRSCMVAPRDYFQDDKEASGILKIIKS